MNMKMNVHELFYSNKSNFEATKRTSEEQCTFHHIENICVHTVHVSILFIQIKMVWEWEGQNRKTYL